MEYVTLGRTNLMVSCSAFGTKLLQEVSLEDSIEILKMFKNKARVAPSLLLLIETN